MSGKQAKAKRKSAKKLSREHFPQAEEFIIGNVRCFAGLQRVPLRPVTLLVGENSTGKTTFLGCYRALRRLLTPAIIFPKARALPRFNAPPFFMGAFDDIVRRENGRHADKQRAFDLGAKIARWPLGEKSFDATYSFRESGAEAAPAAISFVFQDGKKLKVRQGGNATEIVGPNLVLRGKNADIISTLWDTLSSLAGLRHSWPPDDVIAVNRLQEFLEARLGDWHTQNHHVPGIVGDVHSIAPVRSRPERTYDPAPRIPEQEDHICLMADLYRTRRSEWDFLEKRLAAFGELSGMFSAVKVKALGRRVSAPFQLEVKTAGAMANIADVGYGVSQALPLLTQIIRETQLKNWGTFLLQQPEIHLHPQAQAALGTFLVHAARKDGHAFLIETHSDFIVDRVCTHVAKGEIAADDVALLYFEKQKSGGAVKIHRIELNRNGEPVAVPKGYRDFFLRETERVLGLRKD